MSLFVIVTHGTAGDILQLARLARGLSERDHDVVMLTHAPYAGLVRRSGADFVAIDTAEGYQRHLRHTVDLLDLRTPADMGAFYRRGGLFRQLAHEVSTIQQRHRPGATVLLGRHGSALSMLIAAELTGAAAAWVALYPSQLMTAAVGEYFVGGGLGDELNQVRAEFGLSSVVDWPGWLRSPRATVCLWPRWFDAAGVRAPAGASVTGFISGDEEEFGAPTGTAGVARNGSAVVVTGGTGRMLHPEFYRVAVAAAAATGLPVQVVTPHRDLLPDPLPAGATWVPRLSFARALPTAAAIVHHGGIGTAMRALRAGTAQVILAHGLDRPDNAARLASKELARWLPAPRWTVEATAELLRQAVADTGYRARALSCLAGEDTGTAVAAAAASLAALLTPSHDPVAPR